MANREQINPGAILVNRTLPDAPYYLYILSVDFDRAVVWDEWGVSWFALDFLYLEEIHYLGVTPEEEIEELKKYIHERVPLERRRPTYMRVPT